MSLWTTKAHDLLQAQARILAEIITELDVDDPRLPGSRHIASPAGSELALRGIPVVGARGVGGTIRHTHPLNALLSKERRTDVHRPAPISTRRNPRRMLRSMLVARDGPACYLCGETPHIDQLDVEHIIPVSKGGDRDAPENLALACAHCNIEKSDRYVSLDVSSGAPRYHRSQ